MVMVFGDSSVLGNCLVFRLENNSTSAHACELNGTAQVWGEAIKSGSAELVRTSWGFSARSEYAVQGGPCTRASVSSFMDT